MTHGILFRGGALTLLAIALTACGSSDGSDNDVPQPLADSFMALVTAVVATSSDEADPRETDSITATSPQDTDPVAVDG
ncbi:hypothetical protein [Polaromonas sp. CG9_12]|uniref:hypothetical protein n=1 Tax=Polaromonas sp. CG_9.11 TaxID=2787730 RepID=UPI0004DDD79F|nr:hypothetical protein [Polaromonas sp. CG_9.11]MBG6075008.1 hypothetical protein [Polaromonas sp. CG_9.11]CDS55004.1 hypothetical protein [Polaromonas sp. CG9_12]